MSWTKSLRTHRRSIFSAEATNTLMDGWMDGWWADGWVREQTEQRLVSRSFGIWSRKSGNDESLRVSEALNRADEANAPSRHPAPSACVCTRGQQRPLRDTRWAGKLHRRFVLCSLLLGLSSRSLFNILSPFLSPRVCALHVSSFFSVMLLLNLVILYMWYSSFHTWVSLFMWIWCFFNDLFQWH